MGITRISGIPRISANVGDIQNIIANAVVKVMNILIIEVDEREHPLGGSLSALQLV